MTAKVRSPETARILPESFGLAIYSLYTEEGQQQYYDDNEYWEGYEPLPETYGWQNLELKMAFAEKLMPTESAWSMYGVVQERFSQQVNTFIALGVAVLFLATYLFFRKDKKLVDQKNCSSFRKSMAGSKAGSAFILLYAVYFVRLTSLWKKLI